MLSMHHCGLTEALSRETFWRMGRRLPNLLAVRAFEAFARTGTVRSAADELAVSHTVVSRHISNLERALGKKLVKKAGRGLALTREGAQLSNPLRRAFDLIADATAELRRGGNDALHVCCMAGLASRRLLARLPELESALKGREVTLQPTTSRPDFRQDEADAEIFYLENPTFPNGVRAAMFARPRILAVASPAYKARHPEVRSVHELARLPLIHEQSTRQWESWFERAGLAEMPQLRGPRLWHAHLTIEAARLGQGVALVSELLVAENLAAGDLVEMIDVTVYLGGYYFIAPDHRWNEPVMAILRKWLFDTFPESRIRSP